MASSLNASTAGGGGIITTADATGNLNIQSGGSTVVAVTATGATVTGTLAVTGASTLTGQVTATNGIEVAAALATGTGIGASGAGNDLRLYAGGVQSVTITAAGLLKFNSGYGSVATAYGCRAWVNFDGTASGTFAGGTSTVTRIAASTTATITTTTAHGLITGSTVYALTGVVAGTYTVTVLTSTTFTITTVATTALSAVSITFAVNSIRASGNVSSITDNGVGDYTVNFTTAMPDADYAVAIAKSGNTTTNNIVSSLSFYGGNLTPVSSASNHRFQTFSSAFALVDSTIVSIAIFR